MHDGGLDLGVGGGVGVHLGVHLGAWVDGARFYRIFRSGFSTNEWPSGVQEGGQQNT